jgi:tetraacyldisaccharide 4'-kinase
MSAFSRWLQRAWYSPQPVWFFIPLALLFWLLSSLRRGAYRHGMLSIASLPVPVIVVGNVSVGGTGKTPFILWLAAAFREKGYRPGIVTRGYGGTQRLARIVTVASDPREAGDEAVLLARRGGVPVAAGKDRVASALVLLASGKVDLILSDDGLQHYRLARDYEVALLDGERGLGNRWLLPAGPLRETEARLESVQQVVIKQVPGGSFTWPDALRMRLELGDAVSMQDGKRRSLEEFKGQAVHAIAGIGNPGQFFSSLAAAGLRVEGRPLPDHAAISQPDVEFGDGQPVFMTEKDAVKCRGLELPRHWYVEATAVLDPAERARILDDVERILAARGVQPGRPNRGE